MFKKIKFTFPSVLLKCGRDDPLSVWVLQKSHFTTAVLLENMSFISLDVFIKRSENHFFHDLLWMYLCWSGRMTVSLVSKLGFLKACMSGLFPGIRGSLDPKLL